MPLSIIIPTHNKLSRLRLCIQALEEAAPDINEDFEIVVVSDQASDGTNEFIERLIEGQVLPLRLIINSRRGGRSVARNTGAINAKYSHLLFCDDDVLLAANCINEHIKIHRQLNQQLIRSSIMNLPWFAPVNDPRQVTQENIPASLKARIQKMFIPEKLLTGVRGYGRKTKFEADIWRLMTAIPEGEVGRWPGVTGGCLSITRQFFLDIGGFDPQMGKYWGAEDLEFGFRAENYGARIIHLQDFSAFHVDHEKINRDREHQIALDYFEKKHPGVGYRLQSYFQGELDICHIHLGTKSILQKFKTLSLKKGQEVFLQTPEQSITFLSALKKIETLKQIFKSRSNGNPILLLGKNSIAWILHYLALLDAGIPVLPIDPATADEEIEEIIIAANADALIKTDHFTIRWVLQARCQGFPKDLALVFRTSGSTGTPKLALRSAQSLIQEGHIYAQAYGVNAQDCILAVLPLHHAFILGLITGSILTQASSIYLLPAFKTRKIQKQLIKGTISVLPLIPSLASVLAASFNTEKLAPGKLRMIIIGAGATSVHMEKQLLQNLGILPCRNYGSSETGATLGTFGATDQSITGFPLSGVQVQLREKDGKDILHIKTKTPFLGYWKNQRVYRDGLDKQSWFDTGDWAEPGQDGALLIKGRLGLVIRRGGKFIAVNEIINAIEAHPEVLHVQLMNEKDELDNDIIIAKVIISKESQLRDVLMRRFLRTRLADIKIPQRWIWHRTEPTVNNT